MTTIAFVAGMIPLALSSGVGAATNKAISSVIIGGQVFSLLLTLVAIPVMYSLFDDLQRAHLVSRLIEATRRLLGRIPMPARASAVGRRGEPAASDGNGGEGM
jgi:HAE1 family hydrophobic/amphiphilic exporter-1